MRVKFCTRHATGNPRPTGSRQIASPDHGSTFSHISLDMGRSSTCAAARTAYLFRVICTFAPVEKERRKSRPAGKSRISFEDANGKGQRFAPRGGAAPMAGGASAPQRPREGGETAPDPKSCSRRNAAAQRTVWPQLREAPHTTLIPLWWKRNGCVETSRAPRFEGKSLRGGNNVAKTGDLS